MAGTDESDRAPVADAACCPAGRFAAGEDPAKREQILDGASKIFLRLGFDAASMNDIVRESGVSKGTLYVYFENKEQLFAALIERQRQRFSASMRDALARYDSVESGLMQYGTAFATQLCASETICAMRSVLGVADRMPGLTLRFFHAAAPNPRSVLKDFIERETAAGRLAVEDSDLAARQFIELSTGTFFKFRLFGELADVPPREEIEHVVRAAVAMFMASYGKKTD